MNMPPYLIDNPDTLASPSLLVFEHLLDRNLDALIELAGGPGRLRPHCKTHKTREVVRRLLDRGVTRHKCATVREAALCLEAGARDVVLAYQLVGPAVEQFVSLAAAYPHAQLASLVDTPAAAAWLSRTAAEAGVTVGALVDIDTGLHRTGLPLGDAAQALYASLARLPGLRPAGLHVYDAQNNGHAVFAERCAAVDATLAPVLEFAAALGAQGLPVPELLCGGTGTFPCYARYAAPVICSPGTAVFWDHNYSQSFPDLNAHFVPAALLFTRVVSRPTPDRVTLDLGNKAIAADPPAERRGRILGLEDAHSERHNEEHWTLRTPAPVNLSVGDPLLVIPGHICPNANLYPFLYVIDAQGRVCDRWEVAARQRLLA